MYVKSARGQENGGGLEDPKATSASFVLLLLSSTALPCSDEILNLRNLTPALCLFFILPLLWLPSFTFSLIGLSLHMTSLWPPPSEIQQSVFSRTTGRKILRKVTWKQVSSCGKQKGNCGKCHSGVGKDVSEE